MTTCYICEAPIAGYSLSLPKPGLSSLATPIDAATQVALCGVCGHAQSPEPVELEQFYDTEYRISLQSEHFDQVYGVIDGKPEYRTQRQVQVMLELAAPVDDARVLDYGAGKAQSLRRLIAARPEIDGHVFDVSADYRDHWGTFLPRDRTACYSLPDAWLGRFDLITTYFVLEHVIAPVDHLRKLSAFLAPGGRLFVLVPNPITNPGDLLVVDHVQHFTPASLAKACELAGLRVETIDAVGFRGAVALVARNDRPDADALFKTAVAETYDQLRLACVDWSTLARLTDALRDDHSGETIAVHGAGFYGSVIMQRLQDQLNVKYVLDANPHLQGGAFFGRPVLPPSALPTDADLVVAALNPLVAHDIVGDGALYGRPGVRVMFLD